MDERNRGFKEKSEDVRWVLLAYRIPREPSTPRIAVWRKLRQLGAVQIVDGLVALPADNRTREQASWLAEQIRQASGDAWIWEASAVSRAQARELVAAIAAETSAEYEAIAAQAANVARSSAALQARALRRLRRELHRVEGRDYFAVPAKRRAVAALDKLSAALAEVAR